jgi:hypothetical protein
VDTVQQSAQSLLEKSSTPLDTYQVGNLFFTPSYLHAGAIVFLIFLLILTLARLRRLYIGWSLGKSAYAMLFWGFMLAVILEGFLLIGGRTILTELIGWENAPKPILSVLDAGRSKLVDVLGVNQEIPQSFAEGEATVESIIGQYQSLPPEDAEELKNIICAP